MEKINQQGQHPKAGHSFRQELPLIMILIKIQRQEVNQKTSLALYKYTIFEFHQRRGTNHFIFPTFVHKITYTMCLG